MTNRNALYMINSAKKASKVAALLQEQGLAPAHPLTLAASLASEGRHLHLHHPACQAGEVALHLRTLSKFSSKFHLSYPLSVSCRRNICRSMFDLGGLGGMHGASMFDDGDMGGASPFSGFRSASGRMPGGMGDTGSAGFTRTPTQRKSAAPSEVTRPFKVSLEDIYSGATKHLKVSRRKLDGSTEEKVLEIVVQPGWKEGTKIRFPRAGNESSDRTSQDLVFVVQDKPHTHFTRSGDDLIARVEIPLVEALTNEAGAKKQLEHLDGRRLQVPIPTGVVKPGQETRVSGEGMPIRRKGASGKGDLVVRWNVKFPDRLTPGQKEGIRKVLG